jgi:hypothetical protein
MKKPVKYVLFAFLGLCVLRACASLGTAPTSKTVSEVPGATDASTVKRAKDGSDAPQPATLKTKVVEMHGDGPQRSEVFEIRGDHATLSYRVRGDNGMPTLLVYVMKEGTALLKDGGFPEVDKDKNGKGSTELVNGPGRYYLDVKSANCSWGVQIDQRA